MTKNEKILHFVKEPVWLWPVLKSECPIFVSSSWLDLIKAFFKPSFCKITNQNRIYMFLLDAANSCDSISWFPDCWLERNIFEDPLLEVIFEKAYWIKFWFSFAKILNFFGSIPAFKHFLYRHFKHHLFPVSGALQLTPMNLIS